jgi:SAM-dependent methyltransferase
VMFFGTWEDAVKWLIEQPDQEQLVRDCYYDQPLQAAAERYWKSDEWNAIRTFLPEKSGNVLDLGAGQGVSSFALAKDGWNVFALEPDDSKIVGTRAIQSLADDISLSISVVQDKGESMPFLNESFDFVFARQVLHHANNLRRLCGEVFRVLKPGGIFIAVRDHVISSRHDLPRFLEKHPLHKFYGGEHAFHLKEYLEALKSAGFVLKHVLRSFNSVINYAPYTEISLRKEFDFRLSRYPGGTFLSTLLARKYAFHVFLKILSLIDRRPGRLFSFVSYRPANR